MTPQLPLALRWPAHQTFDDFLTGVETFGERIQPLMQCRAHIPAVTKEVA